MLQVLGKASLLFGSQPTTWLCASSSFTVLPRLLRLPRTAVTACGRAFLATGLRGLTVVLGEAWLVLPAKLHPFPALKALMPCLGPKPRILLDTRTVPSGPPANKVS